MAIIRTVDKKKLEIEIGGAMLARHIVSFEDDADE